MQTPYQQVGEDILCLRHGVKFARTESCDQCSADPGPHVDAPAVDASAPPRGCLSTEQIERWHVQQAKEMLTLRRKLTAKPKRKRVATGEQAKGEPVVDLHAYNSAAKLQDCAVKHMRAAGDLAARREDEDLVKQRERIERERERRAAH